MSKESDYEVCLIDKQIELLIQNLHYEEDYVELSSGIVRLDSLFNKYKELTGKGHQSEDLSMFLSADLWTKKGGSYEY